MSLFGRKKMQTPLVDIHSHLIPSIDDGSKSVEESIELLQLLEEMGFKSVVTSPHIHPIYPNKESSIKLLTKKLREYLHKKEIELTLHCAAEYFVDEDFLERIEKKELLTFGHQFVLVEVSFLNKPLIFEEVIFKLKSKGYQPVLAHPERYQFIEGSITWLHELAEMNVFFQCTISSFSGYYGKEPMRIAHMLLKDNMIDFLGSDLHQKHQIEFLIKGLQLKKIQKLIKSDRLLNQSLLSNQS